jgi:hypothetical protein
MSDFNIIIILITVLIVIIYIFVEKYTFLLSTDEKNITLSTKTDLFNKDIFIKYSSIKNRLSSDNDYLELFKMLKTIDKTIYTSVIDNIVTDSNQIIELIVNDIRKTKLKFNFKKLKNIFLIIKIKEQINDLNSSYAKIIMFYDGLIYNKDKFNFVENDFSGNTIIYKLNLNNNLFNHYLQ